MAMTSSQPRGGAGCATPGEYLSALLLAARRQDDKLSVREFSRRLGYKNPSYIADVLADKRRLQASLVNKVAGVLALTDREVAELEIWAARSGRNGAERAVSPSRSTQLALDRFRLVADWFHVAVLEMTHLREFSPEPVEIARRLGRKISSATAKLAVDRLLRLGLIVERGGRIVKADSDLVVGDTVASAAIRQHHLQMLELARESIEKIPVDRRDVRGTTIAIRRQDWPRLKAVVSRFHEDLHSLYTSSEADIVVNISTQSIPLTRFC